MQLPSLSPGYDRTRLLARASRAHTRGRRKRAIHLYRRVLRVEPENYVLRKRVAHLLAQTGQMEAAREGYGLAAEALVRLGFERHAIGVYREALSFLPRERGLWLALCELQLRQESAADAVASLVDGSRSFRGRAGHEDALALLERGHELRPGHVECGLAFAKRLQRSDRARALRVLETVAFHSRGRELRRIRFRQLSMRPTPRALWRWLKSLGPDSRPSRRRRKVVSRRPASRELRVGGE